MHMHFPAEHHLPSRASSTHSEKKKSSSSSASTYSGKSTSSSSSTGSSTSTTRTRSHENDRGIDDGPSITSRTAGSTLVSTASSSSAGSSTSNSPASATRDHDLAHQALLSVTGERVRHGNCPPDFLETYAAHREDQQVEIISGEEASTFFIQYLGDHAGRRASSSRSRRSHGTDESRKIVFAVSGFYYSKRLVDYYLTWRTKSKQQPALEEHQIRLLDEEFKRVVKRIDGDYKAFRRESGSTSGRSSRKRHGYSKDQNDRSRSPKRKTRPPNIELPPPQADLTAPDGASSPEPPVSATSSVISLPYLNMVRGVPLAHRVPLTVTNPDRLSMLSEVDVPLVDPDVSSMEAWSSQAQQANAPAIAIIPPSARALSSQFEPHGADNSTGLTPLMKSSASIFSMDTNSSRSSNSSGGSPELATAELDDPEREPTRFLIVLLGDRLEEGLSWHGIERQSSVRSNTSSMKDRVSPWMGPLAKSDISMLHPPVLHHQRRRRSQRSNNGHTHAGGHESDEESHEANTSWNEGPVVPVKPVLETFGFTPSSDPNTPVSAYPYSPSPVVKPPMSVHGTPYALPPGSIAASPAASTMHLGYAPFAASDLTPRMSMNGSYIPGWAMQSRSAGGSPLSRSDSRVLPGTPVYAASPYLRPTY